MNDKRDSDYRTVRGYQLLNQREGQLTPAMEDYLEMAYRLCLEKDYVRVGQLSELLHVKPSSASRMLSKLAGLGFLQYDRYEIIRLADSGRKIGEYLMKRHATVEAFLELIGSRNTLEETELIEHSLSPSTVSALGVLHAFFSQHPEIAQRYVAFKEEDGAGSYNTVYQ
jgi:Mn-dependent DtxR family transcriptional regulator